MRLFLCFIFPPMAVLMHGKPISAVFNMLLCMFFWVPGVFHALAVNGQAHDRRQTKRLVRAVGGRARGRRAGTIQRRSEPRTEQRLIDSPVVGERGTRFRKLA